jgi:hypothetical protein
MRAKVPIVTSGAKVQIGYNAGGNGGSTMATAAPSHERPASAWAITLSRPAFDLFVGPDGVAARRTWDELLRDVDAFRTLSNDWDGQGAEAPETGVIDGAASLARGLEADAATPADRVIAGENGTVFFEWHGPNGYVEIEVTGPGEAEGRWVPKGANKAVEFNIARRLAG